MSFFEEYNKLVNERAKQNIPPLPLSKEQTLEIIELLKKGEHTKELIELLSHRDRKSVV